jgi:hypothetical protein
MHAPVANWSGTPQSLCAIQTNAKAARTRSSQGRSNTKKPAAEMKSAETMESVQKIRLTSPTVVEKNLATKGIQK